jgi:hypothetical protein
MAAGQVSLADHQTGNQTSRSGCMRCSLFQLIAGWVHYRERPGTLNVRMAQIHTVTSEGWFPLVPDDEGRSWVSVLGHRSAAQETQAESGKSDPQLLILALQLREFNEKSGSPNCMMELIRPHLKEAEIPSAFHPECSGSNSIPTEPRRSQLDSNSDFTRPTSRYFDSVRNWHLTSISRPSSQSVGDTDHRDWVRSRS